MSTISDDVEHLISRLAGPLSPRDRAAFRRAAEDALARVPCWGEGAVYRAVASLQRAFRDPPTDGRAHWDIEQELRPTKLKSAPPIEYGGDLRRVRYRKRGKSMKSALLQFPTTGPQAGESYNDARQDGGVSGAGGLPGAMNEARELAKRGHPVGKFLPAIDCCGKMLAPTRRSHISAPEHLAKNAVKGAAI